jgi:hypothetical protein
VNFELFTTDLSFIEIYAAGLVLVGGKIFLFFSSQIKNSRLNLLSRGALEADVEKVVSRELVFFSALVVFCIGGAFAIGMITPLLKLIMQTWLQSLLYPYIILGLAATIILAIGVVIYLRSHVEINEGGLQSKITEQQHEALKSSVENKTTRLKTGPLSGIRDVFDIVGIKKLRKFKRKIEADT